jgi:repressor LexA
LLPENPDYAPIVVSPDQPGFALEGVAVGLIRNTMLM